MAKEENKERYLLEGMASGSVEAFTEFYEKYHGFIFSIAVHIVKNSSEAEDICHDILLEISQKADTYDPTRGSIEAWIAIRTRSRCMDHLRRKREIPTDSEIDHDSLSIREYISMDETVMRHWDKKLVSLALKNLPDPQRKVIYGSYFNNFTQKELAAHLKLPLGTVKSLVRYGLKNLRKQLVKSKTLNFLKGEDKHDV
ncbi:sigma-70 family RNA polymerase sigma factor [Lederbergia sp. NSJ-179]|uniref:RNA polymerase sigma factor n=1 Tax=Lederbergia sp. NSJ-179 TaxID=2931402 RepID=UPI001FD54F56|nr:sigma-70 family RNA polymerase sigma factor [Lederbergia sp. NSJ-179]MCJ7841163.1 sigma-70 family RNA polymerase sigma factor [Lederbergia sp. NSJ-179]